MNFEEFFELLLNFPSNGECFNFYRDNAEELDVKGGNLLRVENLRKYLKTMYSINPEILFVGEAPGYRGARFSGVPFICESLFGDERIRRFLGDIKFNRTWNGNKPMDELTAKAIWEAVEIIGRPVLFWNIFPFHLHKPGSPLTNRNPGKKEIFKGIIFLRELLKIFKSVKFVIAVGRKAQEGLSYLGINSLYVRHPANGGKKKFLSGINLQILAINLQK
jgi:hypothetical protein